MQAPKGVTFREQEKGASVNLFLTRGEHNSAQQPLQDRCLGRRGHVGSETSDITGVGEAEEGARHLE